MRNIFTAFLALVTCYLHAQRIDPDYNPVISRAGEIHRVVAQPDDKLIVASSTLVSLGSERVCNIIRLHPDGTLDNSFQSGTGFATIGFIPGNLISDVVLAADGKILVSGYFTSYNGKPVFNIARLNPDGTLDESFDAGSGPNQSAEALAVQADGKVIVAGGFTQFNGVEKPYIARLNSDGTLDDTFNPAIGAGTFTIVNSVAIQPDDKVLAGGNFSSVDGESKSNLVRLNADGSVDQSFSGAAADRVYSLALLPDGKIVVGGRGVLTRLNADGSVDQVFVGISESSIVYDLALQPDNKIVAVGTFSTAANRIARYSVDGSQDLTFATSSGLNQLGTSVCVLTDGKIVASGWFNKYQNIFRSGLVRVNSNGSIDADFDPRPGTMAAIIAMEHQADGKLLIGGDFQMIDGNLVKNIARLNPDGTLDNSFTTGSGFESTVTTIKQVKAGPHAGKIIVGGYFYNYNSLPSTQRLVRLNDDGQLDDTFNTGFPNDGYVTSIQISDDDDVIVGGSFELTGGKKSLAKFDATGALVDSFNSDNAITSTVKGTVPWTDNSYLVISNTILRVGTDGNLSPDYNAPAVLPYYAAALTAGGRMLISGSFNNLGGVNTSRLAVLGETGAVDPSFLYSRPFDEFYIKSIVPLGVKYLALALELGFIEGGKSSFGVIDSTGRRIPSDVPIFGDIRTIQAYEEQLYVSGYFYDTTANRNTSLVRVLMDPAPSSAPAELTAAAEGNTIVLSWSAENELRNGFEILRSTGSNENYQVIDIVNPQDRTFSDATVEGSVTYYYKVRAFTTNGPSPSGNEASAIALPKVPIAPAGTVVAELSPSRVKITWEDKSLNEEGFRIYSSTTILREVPADATEVTVDLLTPGTKHFFKVVAYNDQGESSGHSVGHTLSNPSGGSWSHVTSDASLARSGGVAFAIGSKGYVTTGQNQSGRLKDLWEFDPAGNSWNQLADFPGTSRIGAVGFVIADIAYVGLGNDGSGAFRNDFYKYVPAENAWAAIADFPLDPVSGAGRSAATALVIGSYAYVCFGNNGTNFPREFYRYDPAEDSWEKMADFPGTGRSGAVAFTLNGDGYFGLGGISQKHQDFWRYVPAENKWYQEIVNYNSSSAAGAVAFVNSNRAYVGLGDISSSILSESPTTQFNELSERNVQNGLGQWRKANDFSGQARTGSIVFTINNTTYAGLGINNGVYFDDIHKFTSGVHLLPTEPDALSATVVSNHEVKLTWTDLATNEDGYIVECSGGSGFQLVGKLPADVNEFVHTGLDKRQTYSYMLRAFNEFGKSSPTASVSAYTLLPPTAPGSFASQLHNGINIELSWDHSGEDVTKFILDVSLNGDDFFPLSNNISSTDRTFSWDNRPVETQYFFRISAANEAGASQAATTLSVITTQPKPAAPILHNMPVHVGTRVIKISWSDVSANEDGFNIYRSTGDGDPLLMNSVGAGTISYTDTDVLPTQSYTYTVSSYNGIGESLGANNLQVQADIERLVTITSIEQADPRSGPQVTLIWSGNARDTQQYEIQRAVEDTEFELLTTIPASATSYQDSDVEFWKTYQYRIVVHDEFELFDYSNVMSITLSRASGTDNLNEQLNQLHAKIFPNPVVSNLLIESQVPMDQAVLLDVSGKRIRTVHLGGISSTEIQLSDLSAGVYVIKITSKEKMLILRVVKR